MSNFIPKNMNKKGEFIDGISLKEVFVVLRIFSYGLIISLLFYFWLRTVLVFLLPLVFLFYGGMIVYQKSDFLEMNIHETSKIKKKFKKNQKIYFYEYKDGGMKFD